MCVKLEQYVRSHDLCCEVLISPRENNKIGQKKKAARYYNAARQINGEYLGSSYSE